MGPGLLFGLFVVFSGPWASQAVTNAGSNSSLPPTPLDLYREHTNSGLLAIYDTANWWLGSVIQRRTLDYLPDNGITDTEDLLPQWEVLAQYWVGYIIVILVGILSFLGMLLAAFIVPCCRCCSCCGGGTREPRDSKRDSQRSLHRICCGIWLTMFLCATGLGCVAMFGVNEEVKRQMVGDDSVFDQIQYATTGIPDFLDQTIADINETLYDGAVTTTDQVMDTLYKVPSEAFTALDNQTGLTTTFGVLETFSNNLNTINATLEHALELSNELSVNTSILRITLETIQSMINDSLNSCTDANCTDMIYYTTNTLGVEINMVEITTSIGTLASGIALTLDSDFSENVAEINSTINNITRDMQEGLDSEIGQVQTQIDDLLDEVLTEINGLSNTTDTINEKLDNVTELTDEWKQAVLDNSIDVYVHYGFIGLASIPLLIVLLALIGLFHGCCAPRASNDQDSCHVDRSTGSNWLFASIGFIFIFYWFFCLMTLVIFIAGGVTQTEVCRYLVDYDNPKYSAAFDVIENITNRYASLEVNGVQINIMSTYNNCRYDETVYNALPIEEMGLDIDKIANISALEDVINQLKETPIPLPDNVEFLTPEMNTSLYSLDAVMTQVDLTRLLQDLSKNITSPADLDALADELDDLVGLQGVDNDILANATDLLRSTYSEVVVPGEETKQQIYQDISHVNTLMGSISFAGLADSLAEAETVVNTQGDEIVSGIINTTADGVYADISKYVDDSVYAVKNTIGHCFPLYNSTATAINIGCVSVLYQINGLAFALGWILFFLMFGLIFSFKVADHNRRTVTGTPSYTDDEMEFNRSAAAHSNYQYSEDIHAHAHVNQAYKPEEVPVKPSPAAKNVQKTFLPLHEGAGGSKPDYRVPADRSPPPSYSKSRNNIPLPDY